MTLLQKIQNLTWWTLDIKLKDILTDLFGRVEILEESGGGGTQDLQSVLDNGSVANVISPNTNFSAGINLEVSDDISNLYIYGENALFGGNMGIKNGDAYLDKQDNVISKTTTVNISNPTEDTVIYFPAKTVSGNYTINTTPDTTYTVSTLPSGVLNDMAIVTDATAPTYLGALIGGGAVVAPVWHNGTIWVAR